MMQQEKKLFAKKQRDNINQILLNKLLCPTKRTAQCVMQLYYGHSILN